MNRAGLIERLWARCELPRHAVSRVVDTVIAHMIETLAGGERIEIRDFGSFGLRYRNAQARRDPRTGDPISVPAKYLPYFRPGKALRERVNRGHIEKPSSYGKQQTLKMNDKNKTSDPYQIVCAPSTEIEAVIAEKIEEGFIPLGRPVITGVKVVAEGQEIPEMAQTIIKRGYRFYYKH